MDTDEDKHDTVIAQNLNRYSDSVKLIRQAETVLMCVCSSARVCACVRMRACVCVYVCVRVCVLLTDTQKSPLCTPITETNCLQRLTEGQRRYFLRVELALCG